MGVTPRWAHGGQQGGKGEGSGSASVQQGRRQKGMTDTLYLHYIENIYLASGGNFSRIPLGSALGPRWGTSPSSLCAYRTPKPCLQHSVSEARIGPFCVHRNALYKCTFYLLTVTDIVTSVQLVMREHAECSCPFVCRLLTNLHELAYKLSQF